MDTGFVSCTKCKILLSYTPSNGTSHLKRHKCVLVNRSTLIIDNYFEEKLKKDIPTQVANEMVEKCVKMCSLDLRSFEFVDGNGFKELGQYLVNLGAKYGHLDIDNLLPHPTISRNTINPL